MYILYGFCIRCLYFEFWILKDKKHPTITNFLYNNSNYFVFFLLNMPFTFDGKFTICAMTNANVSQAVANDFTELVKSPSITIAKPSTTKLEAIKVTIKAPSTTKIKENKFYINNKEITLKLASNNNNSEMVYQIPKNSLPKKGKTQTIKVLSTANNSQIIYKVVNVTNKNGKYYALSNSPSITDIKYTSNKVVISMKSTGEKINAVEVLDTNNNKMVYSNRKLADKTTEVKIAKSKLNLKNDGYYRIKISVSDKNGAYTVKNIAFKLPIETIAKAPSKTESNNKLVDVKDSDMTVAEMCNHKNEKYTTTSTQHTKICKDCGKTLGKEYHIFGGYDNDNETTHYTSTGKCKICGYECKHKDTSYFYCLKNHNKFCNVCEKILNNENHNVQNGQCTICKVSDSTLENIYYKADNNSTDMAQYSPGIISEKSNSKLDDVKIKVNVKRTSAAVKIYETDAQGKNKKELKITKSKESTSDYDIYVLSHKDLLKGGKHYFYITAKNKYGTSTRYYQIKKASKTENNKTINYYSINASPKILSKISKVTLSNYVLNVTDNSGLESIKITDMNNNDKQIYSYIAKTTKSTRKIVTLNVEKKCKAIDGVYKFKVEMKDKSSGDRVSTMIMTIDTKTSGWHKVTNLYR